MFEKIIFNNLYTYLDTNNLITKNQSGFRPGDSTTNQLLYLVNEIQQAFEDPRSLEVRAVFLDISKAFDKVWHDGLIYKLEQNGVTGSLLKFLQHYLKNRKQRVVLNDSNSNYSTVKSGVPQGSMLGPLLFLVYINDLEKNIKSNINFFADDTLLFSIVNTVVQMLISFTCVLHYIISEHIFNKKNHVTHFVKIIIYKHVVVGETCGKKDNFEKRMVYIMRSLLRQCERFRWNIMIKFT